MIKWLLSVLLMTLLASLVFAQEPLAQPTNLVVSNIKPYSFNLSFDGSASDGYLVVRSYTPLTGDPLDGVEYQKGGGFANGKVFSNTAATFSLIKEVTAGTTYYFTIYAFNGAGSGIDYLQSNPLVAMVTTPDNLIGNYYQSIDQNASSFINDLTFLIQSTHNHIDYYDYGNNIIPAIYERDTVGGKKLVTCQYSGLTAEYYAPFSFTAIDFSREHCLARSWMPSNPTTDDAEAADYFNLLPTDLSGANTPRSNHPFGEVVTPTYTFLDCKLGYNSSGGIVFEPAENIKGDVARSIFYEMVAWDGTGGSNWAFANLDAPGSVQDINTLLLWHYNDPPDASEKAKAEYIYFLQGNRNPFIDYPEWVDCINWYQLIRYPGCYTFAGVNESNPALQQIEVYPNPTQGPIFINTQHLTDINMVSILNAYGQSVQIVRINEQITNNPLKIEIDNVYCGVFYLRIETKSGIINKKIIVQK